jgi:ribonuclease HII
MRVLGLDEAGRGCVLGDLVVGGFVLELDGPPRDLGPADIPLQAALRAAGADDSKVLTHKKRVLARETLRAAGEPHTRSIAPDRIDAGNLNALEIDAFLDIVRATKPDQVFLDAPVNPAGIPRLRADLVKRSGVLRWTIEPKADGTYPVVGAASIFAKVLRDEGIADLSAEYAAMGGVGSGYPSDPVTRAWLQHFIDNALPFPPAVRTRWGTIENLRQPRLF